MNGFLFVGLGGALGAMLRYAISLMPYKGTFPALTFATNVLEAYNLFGQRHYGIAVFYMAASALCCLAGVAAGMYAAEHIG